MLKGQTPASKPPKDGWGPRGVPDCYYTSRPLDSTFRYVKFVRRLRAEEEDIRKGSENAKTELNYKQRDELFTRCDRRALINKVARKVDLCMASYEDDLNVKRKRLRDLLENEERVNTRKFVEEAQAGTAALWEDKQKRLQHLLDKRRKEHEDRYKDVPLSKSPHATACVVALRAKEAQEIQLYQIKEKQARKMAEKEFDIMWYEVAMKEAEALGARMEQDAIERLRRDMECKKYSDMELEDKKRRRELERERLKEETRHFRSIWEEDNRREDEAERIRKEKRLATAAERKAMIEEAHEAQRQQNERDKVINETWDSLAGEGQQKERDEAALRRRKERELDECNRKMLELRDQMKLMEDDLEVMLHEEAQKQQEVVDKRRCRYMLWSQKTNREVRQAMIQQIKDRAAERDRLKQKLAEEDLYHSQLQKQLDELVQNRDKMDAQIRKNHQNDLVQQIQYNQLIKDRAMQEEMDQREKAKVATEEFDNEIAQMLCRPFYSDQVHPFTRQVAKNIQLCPCSERGHCK